MQAPPGTTVRVNEFRGKLTKCIGDKHVDIVTAFGTIVAYCVMDAGYGVGLP